MARSGDGEEYVLVTPRAQRLYDTEHDEKIIAWRADCFVRAGLDYVHALALAVRRDIERTTVERMAANGCPSYLISATLL